MPSTAAQVDDAAGGKVRYPGDQVQARLHPRAGELEVLLRVPGQPGYTHVIVETLGTV